MGFLQFFKAAVAAAYGFVNILAGRGLDLICQTARIRWIVH
jgi:hypothetical protein